MLFAYVVNKLIVFRNYNLRPSYLVKEVGAFVAARAFSGAVTWVLMVVMVKLGGDRGMLYELILQIHILCNQHGTELYFQQTLDIQE